MRRLCLAAVVLCWLCQGAASQDNWQPLIFGSSVSKTLKAVCFFSADTGLTAGDSGLVLTTLDGGKTRQPGDLITAEDWNAMRTGTIPSSALIVGNRGMIAQFAVTGKVLFQAVPVTSANLFGVTNDGVNYDPSVVYACGDSSVVLKSTNGGRQWSPGHAHITPLRLRSITFFNADTGIVVGENGITLRTLNAGKEWKIIDSGGVGMNWNAAVAYPRRPGPTRYQNLCLRVGNHGLVNRSTDYGLTWAAIPSGTKANLWNLAVQDSTAIAVGDSGTILYSSDYGIHWTKHTGRTHSSLRAVDIVLRQSEAKRVAYAIGSSASMVKTQTPSITITSPVRDTALCVATKETLAWKGGDAKWKVRISLVDTDTWKTQSEILPSTPNDGSEAWSIPSSVPSGAYQISIQEVGSLDWAYSNTFGIGRCGCAGNIVLNWSFVDGGIPGVMPSPGQALNWTRAYGTPDVGFADGCGDSMYVGMWGNRAVGEAIQQTLATHLVKGATYALSFCARWVQSPTQPYPVRFAVRASQVMLNSPEDPNGVLIGTTLPVMTAPPDWETIVLPDWVAPAAATIVTISATNQSSFNTGDSTSYGHVDRICIRRVGATGVRESNMAPTEFRLEQNYPNPFNPKTIVSCQWPVVSDVRIVVYDLLGREVSVLVDEQRPAGRYEFEFNASGVASGLYVCRLTAGSFVASRKMMILR
jgi:photosystem II stability/assembly factor-like uncharacterized protein